MISEPHADSIDENAASGRMSDNEPENPQNEGSDTGEADGKEADRRRYWILQRILGLGEVTIEGLRQDPSFRSFRRTFRHVAESTLQDDFREIEKILAHAVSVRRNGSTLCAVKNHASAFWKKGYFTDDVPTDPVKVQDLEAKRRIAEFVVSKLLVSKRDVLYLSTGTTVFQVAVALVHSGMGGIGVVLTDNLGIVEFFAHRVDADPGRLSNVDVQIMGGKVDFASADIVSDAHEVQLSPWRCSTAVIGATGINPTNGQVHSFHQPLVKKWILDEAMVGQVIFPVAPYKIGVAGGRLIYDPNKTDAGDKRPLQDERKFHIVTTNIDDLFKKKLESHGYVVHLADEAKNEGTHADVRHEELVCSTRETEVNRVGG